MRKTLKLTFAAAFLVLTAVGTASAGYVQYGAGMQAVLSGTVADGGVYFEARNTWDNSVPASPPKALTATSFALPACDEVAVSRLILTVWGGTNAYTCSLGVSVNGSSAGAIALGGTGDANPNFDANQPNVYGTGFGVWLLSVPVAPGLLRTDGNANDVAVTVSSGSGFDGRVNQVSLFCVYRKAGLGNSLQYVLAEGSGDIYRATAGALASRTVDLGPADTADVTSAGLQALYTYGDYGQNDRLYFNGVQLGGDDVADRQGNYTGLTYVPDMVRFDVAGILAANNTVKFSVDSNDGIPGTLESSLRPSAVLLEVTRVPEPLTIVLLAAGAAGLLRRRTRAAR